MAKTKRGRTFTGLNANPLKEMADMKYPDLKAACIMKGMDPLDVVIADHGILATFFIKNYSNKRDRNLLEDFDVWQDQQLAKAGYNASDPLRVFRQFSNLDEEENISVKTRKLRRANVPRKVREKKQRSKFGIFTGTKKEFTYTLSDDLLTIKGDKYTNKELMKKYAKKLVNRVQAKYPDAMPKSVRIWMRRAIEAVRPGK